MDYELSTVSARRWVKWGIVGLGTCVFSCPLAAMVAGTSSAALFDILRKANLPISLVNISGAFLSTFAGSMVYGLGTAYLGKRMFDWPLAGSERAWLIACFAGALAGGAIYLVGNLVIPALLSSGLGKLSMLIQASAAFLGGGIAGLAQWLILRRALKDAGVWIVTVAISWFISHHILMWMVSTFDKGDVGIGLGG